MYWRISLDWSAEALLGPAPWLARIDGGADAVRDRNFTDPLRQAGAPATPVTGEEGDQARGTASHA
jgi:hypothetical protein